MTLSSKLRIPLWHLFTLFVLSRTSDNTNSLNNGGRMHGPSPQFKLFWGTSPGQVLPLGLRPCAYDYPMENHSVSWSWTAENLLVLVEAGLMKKSYCKYEFTIVDSCIAQTKSHSQINSLALQLLCDVIGYENQSQHYQSHQYLHCMFRFVLADYHARRVCIPHRLSWTHVATEWER